MRASLTTGGLTGLSIGVLASVSRRLTKFVRSHEIAVDPSAFSPGFFVGIIDFAQGDAAIDYLKRSVDETTLASSGILEEDACTLGGPRLG